VDIAASTFAVKGLRPPTYRARTGKASPTQRSCASKTAANHAPVLEHGFTLLETLVSLVVIGLIMAGLAQGFRFGLAAWDVQARLLAGGGEIDAADRGLRRLIARMDPAGDAAHPPLLGSASGMSFAAPLPLAMTAPGDRRAAMRLALEDGRLVLIWTPAPHAIPLMPMMARRTEVLRGVQSLNLAFFGAIGPGPPAWRTTWNEARLPDLVRLRIVFGRGDPRHWADIVEAPRQALPP
jgi:general secretion pathway protein J